MCLFVDINDIPTRCDESQNNGDRERPAVEGLGSGKRLQANSIPIIVMQGGEREMLLAPVRRRVFPHLPSF